MSGDTQEADVKPAEKARSKRRKVLTWIGGVAAGIVVLFVLIVFVLPSPAARYAIEDQLEQLGIDHQGVDTVEIDLWNGEVAAGPIAFRSQDAKQAQIAEAGFRYDFAHLFENRAFIEVFFIRGVDLEVKRHKDGSITFNGIELTTLLASEEKAQDSEEIAEAEPDGSGFGAGVDQFEFTDSRLVFEDYTGGTLTFMLDRLVLSSFFTWDPDKPGTLELDGSVNDIGIKWRGTALPFAEPKVVTLDSHIRDLTIDKLSQFTGPTGLLQQDGNVETDVRYEYALHQSGLIEGSMDGTYRIADLKIATESGATVALETSTIEIDLAQTIEVDSTMTLTGAITVDSSPLSMVTAAGGAVNLGETSFEIADLYLKRFPETREIGTILAAAKAEIERSDDTPTIVGLMVSSVRDIVLNALEHQVELDGSPALKVKGATLSLPGEIDDSGTKVSFDDLAVSLGEVDNRTLDGGWNTTASLDIALDGLEASTPALDLNTAETRISSQNVEFKRVGIETTLGFDLITTLQDTTLKPQTGGNVAVGQVEFGTTGLTVAGKEGTGRLSGPLSLAINGIEGELPSDGSDLAWQVDSIKMALPTFGLDGDDHLAADLSGSIQTEKLLMEVDGDAPLSMMLGSGQLDLQDIRIDPLASDAELNGALVGLLTDIEIALNESDAGSLFAAGQIETRAESVSAKMADPQTMKLSGGITLTSLSGSLPFATGDTIKGAVGEVKVDLPSLLVEDNSTKAKAEIAAGQIAIQISDQSPQTIDIGAVNIAGVEADLNNAVEAESISINDLNVALTKEIATLGADGGDSTETTESSALPTKLGKVTISPGSKIRFADTTLEPPMTMEIVVETAVVGPIDTGTPETKTDIDLRLATDDGSQASVKGWASPLGAKPDFEMVTDLNRVSLPPFSPYAGSLVGMNVDSGSLTVNAEAAAKSGDLEGNIKVLVEELFLEPLSDEDSEKFESSYGVPVNFAVGVLKNHKGQIDLGFPVSGTVEAPEVDYSEAISMAIAGAAAAILPTSWFGDDGLSFEIQPVVFHPGSAEITEEGSFSADKIGALLVGKPQLTIQLCGRAAAADLVVLRGGDLPEPETPDFADPEESAEQAGAKPEPLTKPTAQEVEALLSLAEDRRKVVQKYLIDSHGIDKAKIFDCRSSYSIESQKPPRAEFRL